MNKLAIKLFIIAMITNFLENIILLFYNGVIIDKNIVLGAFVFGLAFVSLYKLLEVYIK